MSGVTAREEIRALTALRGVAAFAVVLQHYSATAAGWSGKNIPSLAPHGYMAVDFFFVLSGFIMTYTYADAFARKGLSAYPDFLLRRVARVWPLQVFTVLALLASGLAFQVIDGTWGVFRSDNIVFDTFANIFMLQGFDIGANMNGPSGTVSQELGAYIAFPVLLWLALHRNRWIALATLAIAAGIVIREAVLAGGFDLSSRDIGVMVARCFAEFTLGILVWRAWQAQLFRWVGSDTATAGFSAAAALSLGLGLDLIAALLFLPIVLGFAWNTGWPARLAATPVLYFLGVISYSLYLIHSPIRFFQFGLLEQYMPGPTSAATALLTAAALSLTPIPLAWLTYRWVESPGRDLFRAMLPKPKPR